MAFTAARSMNGAKDSGQPLPLIPELFEVFQKWGVPRRGELSMIAGRPGSQKSGLALFCAVKWNLPTIYFTADSSQHTIVTRLASIYADSTSGEIADILGSDDRAAEATAITGLLQASPITFVFDPEPSLNTIDAELDAFVELHDEYPALIYIDNLMDVEALSETEYSSYKSLLLEFKTLARTTGSHVCVLHHANETTDFRYPPSAKELAYKVSQSVERLWCISLEPGPEGSPDATFRLSTTKNRTGKADPSGKDTVELIATPSKTSFRQKPQANFYDQFSGGSDVGQ